MATIEKRATKDGTVDLELSRIAVSVLRQRPRNKACGTNALRALWFFLPHEATYVEGWAGHGLKLSPASLLTFGRFCPSWCLARVD